MIWAGLCCSSIWITFTDSESAAFSSCNPLAVWLSKTALTSRTLGIPVPIQEPALSPTPFRSATQVRSFILINILNDSTACLRKIWDSYQRWPILILDPQCRINRLNCEAQIITTVKELKKIDRCISTRHSIAQFQLKLLWRRGTVAKWFNAQLLREKEAKTIRSQVH